MQLKFGIMALSVMATLVLFGGDAVSAKSGTMDKKEVKIVTTKSKNVNVIVTVKAGDTLTSIADKYGTSYVRLFNANKAVLNADVIDVGDKIRIPAKKEKLKNRVVISSPAQQSYASTAGTSYVSASQQPYAQTARASSAGNTYAWGTCTWYAKQMRSDLPNMLGNGGSWVANASARGIATGSAPRVGAIAEEPGHVAYVEAVSGNSISISEMNYAGGVGQVHRRTVPAGNYRYIY